MANKKLAEIRKEAVNKIKELLKKHKISRLEAVDIAGGDSPILQDDYDDGDRAFTLDRIILDTWDNLTFEGSSAYDNIDFNTDNISTDALLDIQDWLENYEGELKGLGLTEEQREAVKEEVSNYLAPVFQDSVERCDIVETIIEDIYDYLAETCEWDDYADDEYCISDVHIAVQSILCAKIVR